MAQMDSAERETLVQEHFSHTHGLYVSWQRDMNALTFPGWTWQVHVEWYLVHNHRNLLVSVLINYK